MKDQRMLKVITMGLISLFCISAVAENYGQLSYNNTATYANKGINSGKIQRGPFTTSLKMYSEMSRQSGFSNSGNNGFTPGYGIQKLPIMRLKGFVTKNRKNATALLDVEGAGVYMVSKGDQIGLHAIGLNTVLEVMEVTSQGVKVRAGQINQLIVVR